MTKTPAPSEGPATLSQHTQKTRPQDVIQDLEAYWNQYSGNETTHRQMKTQINGKS